MEIESLANKLRPLIPDQITHWLNVRDMTDPDTRTLIEQQIVYQAQQLLATLEANLFPETFAAARQRGQAGTIEEVVETILAWELLPVAV